MGTCARSSELAQPRFLKSEGLSGEIGGCAESTSIEIDEDKTEVP